MIMLEWELENPYSSSSTNYTILGTLLLFSRPQLISVMKRSDETKWSVQPLSIPGTKYVIVQLTKVLMLATLLKLN